VPKFFQVKPTEIKKVQALLSKPKNIVIVTHWSPDGDAMGSSLSLYNYLLKKKHKVTVITPNDYPSFLFWMKGNDKVVNFLTHQKEAKQAVSKANLIFCLDFNSLKRIEKLGDEIKKSKALKMMIDHHQQPDGFADFMLHDVNSCSTCQLIYDFICLMGDQKLIDKHIAACIYTGIMTDTGSFRFRSTTAKTHRVVAELLEAGADNAFIHERIYDDNSEDKLRLLGFCLNEKLTVIQEFKTAFFTLTESEQKRFNYKKGDTEGLVNYALSIDGIKLAGFFVERDESIKISLRSKGDFDVNEFCRKYFNGGGHKNAAGGNSDLSLDELISQFVQLLAQHKKQLLSKK